MIWLAAFIPLVTVLALYLGWHRKIHIGEAAAIMVVPIAFIFCSKGCMETIQTRDTEYLGGWVQEVEYYEDWDEKVSCRHPEYCTRTVSRRDSEGRSYTTTERYQCGWQHLYDVDYHPPRWQSATTLGTHSISEARFNHLVSQFDNKSFVDLNRRYHSNDGDKYVSKWRGEAVRIEPYSVQHTYENRTQVSKSVYTYPDVDPKVYGLFDYPGLDGDGKQPFLLGVTGSSTTIVQRKLEYLNSTLGPKKQVRVFIIGFKDKPIQAGFDQQTYWKGGNKNEMVITIGSSGDGDVQWCHVFSWSEKEDLKIDIRQKIMEQKKLDLVDFVDWLYPELDKRFIRKRFRDFDYLTVQPPLWYVIITILAVAGMCIGFGFWAVRNDVSHGGINEQESNPTRAGRPAFVWPRPGGRTRRRLL